MGIIDDLAMGLGMKARTEDYDARTARTIARNEGADVGQSRAAQQYLGGRGYDEGYRPQVAQDDRPFFQRLFRSPDSQYSPTPYAIGPMQMDQAIPALGPMGLLMRFMGGGSTQPTAEDIAFIRSIPQREIGGGVLPKPTSAPTSVDVKPVDVGKVDALSSLTPTFTTKQREGGEGSYNFANYGDLYRDGWDDDTIAQLRENDPLAFEGLMKMYEIEGY